MKIVRIIAGFLIGLVIGGVVNMSLIMAGPHIIPPPSGVDVTDAKSLAASIHLFSAKHFIFPFLAHAAGTFAGALTGFLIAGSHKSIVAYAIGVLFLCGGIAAAFMIPAPVTFIVIDLVIAYIPMAWLAVTAGRTLQRG